MHLPYVINNVMRDILIIIVGTRVKTYLMGKMMEAAIAETMQFGAAELQEDLYSPYADIAASEFNRQPFAHHEEYVGGLTANTRKYSRLNTYMINSLLRSLLL